MSTTVGRALAGTKRLLASRSSPNAAGAVGWGLANPSCGNKIACQVIKQRLGNDVYAIFFHGCECTVTRILALDETPPRHGLLAFRTLLPSL